jgi:regulatory protein
LNKPATPPSLKGRALRLLSQREHSRSELERKLAQHEEVPGELAQALDELQTRDFLNDGRVIESVVHRRSGKLGAARLQQELAAKGLTGEAVATAMAGLRDTEFSRAQAVWRKKFDRPASEPNARAKQVRFLMTRGFSTEVVRQVLQAANDSASDLDPDLD